jgi:acyl carrier protein
MDAEQIALRVRQLVSEVCDDCDIDLVHGNSKLEENFGLDSFERVELLNAIEDDFHIVFPAPQDRDLTSPSTTVRDLFEAVERALAAKGTLA